MLTILGAVAEMEQEITVEQIREDMTKAKRYGTRLRPPCWPPDARDTNQLQEVLSDVERWRDYSHRLRPINQCEPANIISVYPALWLTFTGIE